MAKWIWLREGYNFRPTPEKYIKYRWHHYVFCKNSDVSITASLYLDDLQDEMINELKRYKAVSKRSLILKSIQKILLNAAFKKEMITLFEKAQVSRQDIKEFLEKTAEVSKNGFMEKTAIETSDSMQDAFHTRTYIIATHLYYELLKDESQYNALMRDTPALKTFIEEKFRPGKLSNRLSDMKGFSYKSVLDKKNNDAEKGQLKPQLKQIMANPQVFGKEISTLAEEVFNQHF